MYIRNGWRKSLMATTQCCESWRQHPTKQQLYDHLPPITKTVKVRQTRHAGHCWRSKDKLISDVLLWTPLHGQAKAGQPAQTYKQQLCEDTRCSPEDLPEAMNDWEEWRERVRDTRAGGTTWWWWWWYKKIVYRIQNCNILVSIVMLKWGIHSWNFGHSGFRTPN